MNFFRTINKDISRYKIDNKIDWSEPSIIVIIIYRWGKSIQKIKFKPLKFIFKICHLPFFVFFTLLTGIHLPRNCEIEPGFRIFHFGCIILNPLAKIGTNCTMRHGVTIGNRQEIDDVPVLGDNVDIGAGAKILGKIKIGNNVSIGANAVVLCDVPDNHIAVGVPARIIPKKAI